MLNIIELYSCIPSKLERYVGKSVLTTGKQSYQVRSELGSWAVLQPLTFYNVSVKKIYLLYVQVDMCLLGDDMHSESQGMRNFNDPVQLQSILEAVCRNATTATLVASLINNGISAVTWCWL